MAIALNDVRFWVNSGISLKTALPKMGRARSGLVSSKRAGLLPVQQKLLARNSAPVRARHLPASRELSGIVGTLSVRWIPSVE